RRAGTEYRARRAEAKGLLPSNRATGGSGITTVARAARPHVAREEGGRINRHGVGRVDCHTPSAGILPPIAYEARKLHGARDRIEAAVAIRLEAISNPPTGRG